MIRCAANIGWKLNIRNYGIIRCAENIVDFMHTGHPLIDRFLSSLQAIPGVLVETGRDEGVSEHGIYDARINLHLAHTPITLRIEARKTVYPRDVREVLWQFKHLERRAVIGERETYPVLVAESISPGAKELLRAEGAAYFDSGGSLFLPARAAYLYIDRPPPKSLQRSIRATFSGRRAQVLHALLVRDRTWFGVTGIAQEAKVAPSTASEVLSQLDRFEWVESRGQGPGKERRLTDPGALLDAWVKQQALLRPSPMRRYYVPGFKAEALLDHIGRIFALHQVDYAVTAEAAAQRYAPFLTGVSAVRTRMLAGPAADASVAELGARVVNEGSNLIVLETKSAGELLFSEQIGGIWLASPVQVYLDLLRGEGRAKELADHLRREKIRF